MMDYKTLISSLPKLDNVLSPVAKNTSLSNAAVALRNKLMNSAYGGAQKVLDAGANVSEYISKNTNPAFIRSMKKTADWRQKFLPWGLGAAGVGAGAYGLSKLLEEKPWYMKALDSLQQKGIPGHCHSFFAPSTDGSALSLKICQSPKIRKRLWILGALSLE